MQIHHNGPLNLHCNSNWILISVFSILNSVLHKFMQPGTPLIYFAYIQNSQDILSENKDAYMINPCSATIWFIVELCELVSVRSLEIASFELFSSTPKSFKVYASER